MKENTVVRGFVQGQAVEIVLDKGVSCILVHQDLVPPEKVDASQKLEVQCTTLQNTPQPSWRSASMVLRTKLGLGSRRRFRDTFSLYVTWRPF